MSDANLLVPTSFPRGRGEHSLAGVLACRLRGLQLREQRRTSPEAQASPASPLSPPIREAGTETAAYSVVASIVDDAGE